MDIQNTDTLAILEENQEFYATLMNIGVHDLRNANVTININPDGKMKVRVEQVVFHYRKSQQ